MPTTTTTTSTYKEQLLRLLVKHKYLTVKQAWELTVAKDGHPIEQTRKELNRMKKAGLVTNVRLIREAGWAAEKCWLLLQPGANLIGFTGYDKHYKRTPSRERVKLRDMEFALREQIELAGRGEWELVEPLTYNSRSKRLPPKTEQYHRLCRAATWNEYRKQAAGYRQPTPLDPYGPHTLGIPHQANDFLASYNNGDIEKDAAAAVPGNDRPRPAAVVLILCPPRATEKFWQARGNQYDRTAQLLNSVYGVFPDRQLAQAHETLLSKFRLKLVALDQVAELLADLAGGGKGGEVGKVFGGNYTDAYPHDNKR